jgi:hypothetical protein
MGRGRQKAKQTKVARELKYSSYEPNYRALEQELTSGGRRSDVVAESRPVPEPVGDADELAEWSAEDR